MLDILMIMAIILIFIPIFRLNLDVGLFVLGLTLLAVVNKSVNKERGDGE